MKKSTQTGIHRMLAALGRCFTCDPGGTQSADSNPLYGRFDDGESSAPPTSGHAIWLCVSQDSAVRPKALSQALLCRGDLQPTQYAGVGLLLEDLGGSFLVFQMLDGGPAKGCGKFEVAPPRLCIRSVACQVATAGASLFRRTTPTRNGSAGWAANPIDR